MKRSHRIAKYHFCPGLVSYIKELESTIGKSDSWRCQQGNWRVMMRLPLERERRSAAVQSMSNRHDHSGKPLLRPSQYFWPRLRQFNCQAGKNQGQPHDAGRNVSRNPELVSLFFLVSRDCSPAQPHQPPTSSCCDLRKHLTSYRAL